MVPLVFLLLLTTLFRVGLADVQDVTSVFRFRETGVGDDFVAVEDCFGLARSCPWYNSGWEVIHSEEGWKSNMAGIDRCAKTANSSNNYSPEVGKHTIPAQELSPWILVDSNHAAKILVEPTSTEVSNSVNLYLFEEGGTDYEMGNTSMLMIKLSSDNRHVAHVCYREQKTGQEVLIVSKSVKVLRKCSPIPDMFVTTPSDSTPGTASYQIETNLRTGQLTINRRVGCKSEPLLRQGYGLTVYGRYMRLLSNDGDFRYSQATLGFLLMDHRGEIVSRDIEVTPRASRLCLAISVTRNVFSTGLQVVVRAKDGRQIEFENSDATGIDLSQTWRQINVWNYVADLNEFENQTVDIQIVATSRKKGNLFISAITPCKGIGSSEEITIIHQSATLEIHGNASESNALFLLPDNRVLGPNVGVPSECIATADGCMDWTGLGISDWTVQSSVRDKNLPRPRLEIGMQSFLDSIGDVAVEDEFSRQFVDAVEIWLHDIDGVGDPDRSHPDYFRAVLFDEFANMTTTDIYVLAIGLLKANEPDVPVLYKCEYDIGTTPVKLTRDFTRDDCVELVKGKSRLRKTQDLRLQISVIAATQGEQEIIVSYFDDSTKDTKEKVLSYKDSSPRIVTRYLLSSPSEESAFATSHGSGYIFYSLDKKTAEVHSPTFSVPKDGNICLALEYFVDGNVGASPFTVKVVGEDGQETTMNNGYTNNTAGKWMNNKVTGKTHPDLQVSLKVTFTKPDPGRLLLQRLSFCHQQEFDVNIYERAERSSLTIFHPGAKLAYNRTQFSDENTATSCWNGGKLQASGCDCPAGFNGTQCEEGCGPNRYGSKCQQLCSYTTRGCRGMLMGRPYLGFNCAPGFGGPLCDTPCNASVNTVKTYGAGCLQQCGRCANDTPCDAYTGVCPDGCQPGMVPPQCKQEFVYLTTLPNVTTVTADSAELEIDLRNRTEGSGVRFWQVQYKLVGGTEWLESEKKPFRKDLSDSTVKHKLKELSHGTEYQARVVLLTTNLGQNYQGDKIPQVTFTTLCKELFSNEYLPTAIPLPKKPGLQVSWKYTPDAGACRIVAYEVQVKGGWRWNVYRYSAASLLHSEVNLTDLLPGHTYHVRVRALTASGSGPFSAIVRATVGGSIAPLPVRDLHVAPIVEGALPVLWNAPRFTATGATVSYDVKYQCVTLLACPNLECPDQEIKTRTENYVLNLNVSHLRAYARYRVWVRPVIVENDTEVLGEERSVLFDTAPKNTTVRPTKVDQNPELNTETSVTVSWGRPDSSACHELNGALVGFRCEISPRPTDGLHRVETTETFVTFSGLTPVTEYHVKVFVRTSAGVNMEKYININVKTHSPNPKEVASLAIYSKTSSALSLRWRPPQWNYDSDYTDEPLVEIDHYVIEYAPFEGGEVKVENVPRDSECAAWPKQICHQIARLTTDTKYRLSVYAVSEDAKKGIRAERTAITMEEVPGAPSYLSFTSATSDSITFSVGIPDMLNGVLTRFQIFVNRETKVIEEAYADDFIFEVKKIGEKPSYEYTIENLKANAIYNVKVKAMTQLGLGDAVSKNMTTSKPSKYW